jgi:two-component system chemotaxis sensor kinase CheA
MSDDIVREFLVESGENLNLLDRELIHLEKDPGNRDTLASVFRTIHTIKGTCGFLGFTKLESVAHAGENLLSKLRDGELGLRPEITTALLQMVDAVRQMLASVEAIGNEGERNDQELIKTLTRLLQGSAPAAGGSAAPATVAARVPAVASPGAVAPSVAAPLAAAAPLTGVEPGAGGSPEATAKPESKTETHELAVAERNEAGSQPAAESAPSQTRGAVSESSIRVDVVLLDKLMNLVGELVLARNQILQFSNGTEDVGLVVPASG